MKPKTEAFLNFLLWSTDKFANPTFRNLTDSYEGWAYRNGLFRQVAALEKLQLVERDAALQRPPLLPDKQGRLHALGGRDPQARWKRKWDGHWRLVLFDVPVSRKSYHVRLWRYLRRQGVRLPAKQRVDYPDSLAEERQILGGGKINVESLILLEARPCAGESDEEIGAGAWDSRALSAADAEIRRFWASDRQGRWE